MSSLQVLEGHSEVSLEPALLQAEEAQISQLFFIGEALQPSDHLCDLPLEPLQQFCLFSVLGAPYQDTVLQVGPYWNDMLKDISEKIYVILVQLVFVNIKLQEDFWRPPVLLCMQCFLFYRNFVLYNNTLSFFSNSLSLLYCLSKGNSSFAKHC